MNELLDRLNSDFPVKENDEIQMVDVLNTGYCLALNKIIPLLQRNSTKICIVSTSRNGEKLLNELNKSKINTKNIFVVSGIRNGETERIKIYEPVWKIDSLKKGISFAIKNFAPEIIVFDSITNLCLFMRRNEINEFIEKFVSILRERKIKGIFLNISNETPDEIALNVEAVMDKRIPIEKFTGKKLKAKPPTEKQQIKPHTKEQKIDVRELKKSLSQLIKEEARKIAEETRKNLAIKKPEKQKKQNVHKLEKEREKQNLLKKMELLEKSFELGVISKEALEEGKRQIKQKLREI
jgi:hypothetical protein